MRLFQQKFYSAFLPFLLLINNFVYSEFDESLDRDVRNMIKMDGDINEQFKIKDIDRVEHGSTGHVYEGFRIEDNEPVALKFASTTKKEEMDREFEMYTYLNAIDNTDVEIYGIPTIYYYGQWQEYIVLVMTFFGADAIDIGRENRFINRANGLMMLRDFIYTSKYMASRGVRHDDIKPANMMIDTKRNRWFIVDFNLSAKMKEASHHGTLAYLSRRGHLCELRGPADEWESFLYSFCYLHRIHLPWLFNETLDGKEDNEREDIITELKDGKTTVRRILEDTDGGPFTEILLQFADQAVDFADAENSSDDNCSDDDSIDTIIYDGKTPDYDGMYENVTRKIVEMLGWEPILFTWLTDKEKEKVRSELLKPRNRQIDIKDITIPENFSYAQVDYEYFEKKQSAKRNSSTKSDNSAAKRPKHILTTGRRASDKKINDPKSPQSPRSARTSESDKLSPSFPMLSFTEIQPSSKPVLSRNSSGTNPSPLTKEPPQDSVVFVPTISRASSQQQAHGDDKIPKKNQQAAQSDNIKFNQSQSSLLIDTNQSEYPDIEKQLSTPP